MNRISLIRHGRPAANLASGITGHEFEKWLRDYDDAGIDASLPPPSALLQSLSNCALVLTSPAARAVESAAMLGLSVRQEVCADAIEAPLPTRIFWPLPTRPATLTAVARISWLLGVGRAKKNKKDVRDRAQKLAQLLSLRAADCGHVALVTHGYLIRFLRPVLEHSGWRPSAGRSFGYWSCAHFDRAQSATDGNQSAVYFASIPEPHDPLSVTK